jgi:high-affinity iron transporter
MSSAPVWLGLLGAVIVACSFAAVLTFSTSELSNRAHETAEGLLSVLAVGRIRARLILIADWRHDD